MIVYILFKLNIVVVRFLVLYFVENCNVPKVKQTATPLHTPTPSPIPHPVDKANRSTAKQDACQQSDKWYQRNNNFF